MTFCQLRLGFSSFARRGDCSLSPVLKQPAGAHLAAREVLDRHAGARSMKYRYPQNRKITANISVELVSLVAWNQDCSGHRSRHLHSESDSLRGMLRMQGGAGNCPLRTTDVPSVQL